MFDRIQNIQEIVGDNNIIINGDVTVDEKALSAIAYQLLSSELNKLTHEAKTQMQELMDECVHRIFEQIVERKIVSELSEFSKPSTQFSFHTLLKGFIAVETIEQRDLLVDAFIERIQTDWNSAEKMILDSALEVLPKLSPSALATIGLLQIRHQLTNSRVGFLLHQYFTDLTPLAESMASVNSLDIEYLKQERLILPLPGLRSTVPLEKFLLTQYDLFFRHPLREGVYDEYCRFHPEAHEAVTNDGVCMMWVDGVHNNETSFCCANSKLLEETLVKRHQEYIVTHVESLKKMMPPFTEEEVRNYFISLSPSWGRLFTLFSTDSFILYTLSITGNYIGGKVLAKVSHAKPLTLTDYKQIDLL